MVEICEIVINDGKKKKHKFMRLLLALFHIRIDLI